jgi:hypothetical protein
LKPGGFKRRVNCIIQLAPSPTLNMMMASFFPMSTKFQFVAAQIECECTIWKPVTSSFLYERHRLELESKL